MGGYFVWFSIFIHCPMYSQMYLHLIKHLTLGLVEKHRQLGSRLNEVPSSNLCVVVATGGLKLAVFFGEFQISHTA